MTRLSQSDTRTVNIVSPIYYPIDPGTDLAAGGVPTGAFQTRNHSLWKIMLFARSDNHELVEAEATAR